ncbi:MAG: VIT1/CCC1 transporter family protein [Chitinophagaceae bacterium]|nr:VIT1/CCC1 transporter family protein [Anaerolineae bacterium]
MSISKRVDEARKSFEKGDVEAAKRLHNNPVAGQERASSVALGTYIGPMVYGGLDGIVTTFAVVSGVAGAALGANIILILGIANLLADGLSMAIGAYLSAKSEGEYYDREARRQAWEIDQIPDGQQAELKQLYLSQGYDETEAARLVEIISTDKTRWIRAMMIEELSLLPDESKPIINSLATFAAFVIAGSLPLLVYLLGLVIEIAPETAFTVSIISSGIALFLLGAAKVLVTGLNPLRSGLEMLIVGGGAAGIAYIVGALLKNIGA